MTSLPRRLCGIAMLTGLIALNASHAGAGNFAPNIATRTSNQAYNQSVNVIAGRQTNAGYGATGHAAPPARYPGEHSRPHHYDPNTQFDGLGNVSAAGGLKPPK